MINISSFVGFTMEQSIEYQMKRYTKFIEGRKNREIDKNFTYTEIHHINPRSLGGTNDVDNLICLTAREHYIAHWMLFKVYPNSYKMFNAFYSMCCKNSGKIEYNIVSFKRLLNSKTFQILKNKNSEYRKGKVFVIEKATGLNTMITKHEFRANREKYSYYTEGMVSVFDEEGNTCYIDCDTYHKNKNKYSHRNSGKVFVYSKKESENNGVWLDINEYENNKHLYITHSTGLVTVRDITGNKVRIPTEIYQLNKNEFTHKNSGLLSVRDLNGIEQLITVDEYNNNRDLYIHKNKNYINVFNDSGDRLRITMDEYRKNKSLYKTISSGTVVVFNSLGKRIRISKNEYAKNAGSYTPYKKNDITLLNPDGEKLSITSSEYKINREYYRSLGFRTAFEFAKIQYYDKYYNIIVHLTSEEARNLNKVYERNRFLQLSKMKNQIKDNENGN
jgi:hypothetical protein